MLDPADIPDHSETSSEEKKHHDSVAINDGHYQLPQERNFVGRLRHKLREPLAEFIATCVMIVLGDGVVAQVVLSDNAKGQYLSISFGWCFAVMCAIYIAGGISGAHLNPAVTLCMAVWRGFPWRKVPAYWLAQFLGALTGAAIVFADYRKAISSFAGEGVYTVTGTNATAGLFSTYPAAFMTPEGSFFSEVLGTCILLLVILGQADDHNMHAAKNSPLVVAFTVAGIGISLGWETGYAINPARDFGPRCFAAMAGYGSEVFTNSGSYTWVPIIGPFVGAVLAGLIYEILIDSESNRSRLTHSHI
ncbi:hypothetical protein K450DRAFT_295570 [Umbelopsis ramanniana AG]|uniref:Aquaporin n=1 Tax=Umbelopsis ramanniana AG TaxID=1314678 RepID=A0AAD5H9Z6_UMBRA|nr:uncharacterized protein K450DRAFT_295570 [Umbelopsis ramanniana AG]KAI8576422.1 hypothetical protein K450DRAFT_295570 [Umbelopsis ramanniana AG]